MLLVFVSMKILTKLLILSFIRKTYSTHPRKFEMQQVLRHITVKESDAAEVCTYEIVLTGHFNLFTHQENLFLLIH